MQPSTYAQYVLQHGRTEYERREVRPEDVGTVAFVMKNPETMRPKATVVGDDIEVFGVTHEHAFATVRVPVLVVWDALEAAENEKHEARLGGAY